MNKREISKEIYNKVIEELPLRIIEMLPEEPEKLLPYAKRVKEIQFSSNVKEDVRRLMRKYLLDDTEYLKTFYYVMAITFYHKKTVIKPKLEIVVAQTGSGKSNLTAKLLRQNHNYIFVDSDKYKHYRFDAQYIANNYQLLYPFLTGPDAYNHAENIYEYAIDKKYNIIKETAPSANKGLLEMDVQQFKKKDYKISVHILSVGELNSALSTHERYELQIIHGLKTSKLTSLLRHDESYNSLIRNTEEILNNKDISSISVYKRGVKEENFNPIEIYPSEEYKNPIEAIIDGRQIDNAKTKIEFDDRYKLLKKQMKERNAPQEQYNQLEEIKLRSK